MLENLLYRERFREDFRQIREAGCLPPALLFHGPAYGGKLTAALEVARGISCREKDAPWGCTCTSCQQHRILMSPYLMMAGRRYHGREIRAAAASLGMEDRDGTRFLFLRSVRKLQRRFDPVLWDGETKYPQAIKLLEDLDGRMEVLMPGQPALDAGALEKVMGKVIPLCDSLQALLPRDGINIQMVRHLSLWAHTADTQLPKFIIIETADAMNEACRNSLLKILEEPPPAVWFILTATHRQAIMPTILSRVRPFAFPGRGEKEAEVISGIFRHAGHPARSLQEFFTCFSALAAEGGMEVITALEGLLLRKAGLPFLAGEGRPVSLAGVLGMLPDDRQDQLDAFLLVCHRLGRLGAGLGQGESARALAARGMDATAVLDSLQGLARLLRSGMQDMGAYNIPGSSVVETVYSHAGEGPCAVLYREH